MIVRERAGTGKARRGAVYALILTCACATAASQSGSASDAGGKKTTAAKPGVTHRKGTSSISTSASGTKHSPHKKKSVRVRGQQKIDSERSQTIQEALIREHYLTGEPTGTWSPACEEAMRRYQNDNGWQTKEVPDSRALIKLGLGPSHDHLLNPESAMTTMPDPPHTATPTATPNPSHNDPTSPQ